MAVCRGTGYAQFGFRTSASLQEWVWFCQTLEAALVRGNVGSRFLCRGFFVRGLGSRAAFTSDGIPSISQLIRQMELVLGDVGVGITVAVEWVEDGGLLLVGK